MLCLEHVSLEFFERKVGDLSEKMEDEFLLVRRNECYIYLWQTTVIVNLVREKIGDFKVQKNT